MVQANAQNKLQQRYYRAQLAIALTNVLVSLYLSVQHTRLKLGIQDSGSFCSLGKFADCDIVHASTYSELFGIPLASIGAVFYFLLFALGILARPQDRGFGYAQKLVAWIATAGVVVNFAILEPIQIFLIQSICLFCNLTYLIGLAHLFTVVRSSSTSEKFWNAYKELLTGVEKFRKDVFSNVRMGYVGLSAALLVAVTALIPTYFRTQSAVYQNVDDQLKKFYSEWKDKPSRKLEVEEHNGTFGNPNAKVQIVEFSDFECPYCRKAAFTLHAMLKPLKDRVHFVFKQFPLSSTCNPAMQYQMHPHACDLAKVTICAGTKGKFWDAHDRIFLKMSEDDLKKSWTDVEKNFHDLLSPKEIRDCLNNPKIQSAISEDIQLGLATRITGTPAIYINGKHVTAPLNIEVLSRLIEEEERLSAH